MKTKRKDIVEPVPGRTTLTPFEEMDRMFDTLLHRGWLRPFSDMWPEWMRRGEAFEFTPPRVDVIDREEEFLVQAELPGVKKKDLTVEITDRTLTLKGERRHEEEETEGEFYRSEITHGAFSRTIPLPEVVNPEAVKAEFEDGMLEIHLPKMQKVERHRIDVQ